MPGGTRGYLKSMGFLYQNLLNELGRSKRPKKAARPDSEEGEDDLEVGEGGEEENENSNNEDNMPGRSGERNRLVGLQSLGFGQKSFNYPSPYQGRKPGISARKQASQENRLALEKFDLKGKDCLKCGKRFRDGAVLKSQVLRCKSCLGFVHEKSGRCSVNLTRGNPASFKCPTCSQEQETGILRISQLEYNSILISTLITFLKEVKVH